MLYSAVLCCLLLLLLSIVQATAICSQQGTQDCDQTLVTAACNDLRATGEKVPISCPPIASCLDIHLANSSAPSGNYQIELSNGTMVNVYCDMAGTNCNGEGGWTRVAFVNMSQPGANCPTGLTQIEKSNLTLCTRESNTDQIQGTFFTTLGLSYCAVCGRLRGYQDGKTDAFSNSFTENLINEQYADGVSITHGNPRQHIWTYAASASSVTRIDDACPCSVNIGFPIPSFVGNNYYCESGTNSNDASVGELFPNDPLWDGMQCNNETACCTNPNLPWFSTTLPEITNDDIELRLLTNAPRNIEDVPLDLIELYIR